PRARAKRTSRTGDLEPEGGITGEAEPKRYSSNVKCSRRSSGGGSIWLATPDKRDHFSPRVDQVRAVDGGEAIMLGLGCILGYIPFAGGRPGNGAGLEIPPRVFTYRMNREYWYEMGRAAVLRRAGSRSYEQLGKAKNVVLLVADGLGVTTNTAARVYKGQRHGQTGEEASLAWDNFPALAMTKMGTSRRHQDSSEDHMLNDHALKEGHVLDRSQVSILGPENPEAPENKKSSERPVYVLRTSFLLYSTSLV
ncbi:unnamed protein product, partial [Nesidiocoris tenuis]